MKTNIDTRRHTSFKMFNDDYSKKYLVFHPTDFFWVKTDYQLPLDINFKNYTNNNTLYNILDFIAFDDRVHAKLKEVTRDVLHNNNYNALHYRCGDKFLNIKPKKGYFCPTDSRICAVPKLFDRIEKTLEIIEKNDNAVVFFSDNQEIKKIVAKIYPQIKIIDSKIIHVSFDYSSQYVENIDEHYIDTIVEFMLLINSSNTYAISYSGFSFFSSFLSNKKVIKMYD